MNGKFRAWDNEKNKYFEPTYMSYAREIEDLQIGLNGRLTLRTMYDLIDESMFPNRFIIEHYTGLKDKSGKEIYEGDICKWRFKRPWSTEYHIAEVVWRQSKCGWRLNTIGDTSKMREDIEYEIIGNIHETPELLEVAK